MNKNVCVTSVGCRLNQFETDMLRSEFVRCGLASDNTREPDIWVINTCTVTQRADSKSRALVKRIIKNYPEAYIVVTGCYAHTNPDVFKNIKGVDLIVDNTQKMRIPEILKQKGIIEKKNEDEKCIYITDRTRPYIKIQDGCNLNCSYCKVRIARGRSRSENFDKIIETAKLLSQKGYPEIVITGVNIGDYKWEDKQLADLLLKLIEIKGIKRIRLTSIEPTDIDEKLLDVISHNKICAYFHIPLQSGSDKILKLMNRPYTRKIYENIVMQIKNKRDDAIIGTDVIVGFPSETEKEFNETFSLLKELDIFYLHIFRYSKREGTPAYNFREEVPEEEKFKRAEILREYRSKRKDEFFSSLIGKSLDVIVEHKIIDDQYINSISDNYIPVLLPVSEAEKYQRKIIKIEVKKYERNHLYGKIL